MCIRDRNGADGLGIKSLTLSPDGELVVTMSDNSISNLGNIKGDKGDRGEQGLSLIHISRYHFRGFSAL